MFSSFVLDYVRMWTSTYSSDVDLSWLLDITKPAAVLGRDVCTALLGFHPWTGCDAISAFAGQGKLKALKILLREQKFIDAFATLGSSWNVANDLFCIIEEFVCQLYCRNTKILKVNELRYQMFSSRRGEMESAELPPCEDTLKQHILRANYKAAIWWRILVNSPETPRAWMDDKWRWQPRDKLDDKIASSASGSQFAVVQMRSGLSAKWLHIHR